MSYQKFPDFSPTHLYYTLTNQIKKYFDIYV